QQQGVTFAGAINPNSANGWMLFTWVDANGDGTFQFGEQTTLLRQFFPSVSTQLDRQLSSPTTDELEFGVEHELFENFSLSGSFIYRDDNNFIEDVNSGVPFGPFAAQLGVADPFTPVQVTDPGPDGAFGTADDGGPLTIFNQDPSTLGQDVFFITNPENLGFTNLFNRYKGVSFVAHKRWSNNWQLLASWDVGEATTAFGFAGGSIATGPILDNPNGDLNRAGLSGFDRKHIVKVTGNYLFPDPIGINLGVFLRFQSGEPVPRDFRFSGSTFGLNQGTTTVNLAARGRDINPAGVRRLQNVKILDVRGEKQFRLGGAGMIHGYADLFNVFNTSTISSQRTRSASNFGGVRDLVSPRVFRLGIMYDF
ncbi:MAG: hypothetical protein ACE5HV_14820, partial [Acidobacteriota bacterium]